MRLFSSRSCLQLCIPIACSLVLAFTSVHATNPCHYISSRDPAFLLCSIPLPHILPDCFVISPVTWFRILSHCILMVSLLHLFFACRVWISIRIRYGLVIPSLYHPRCNSLVLLPSYLHLDARLNGEPDRYARICPTK